MSSPFPGMDPFLEDPAVFPDLHDSLITYLREALNATLPPPYFAGIASRVRMGPTHLHVEPDFYAPGPDAPPKCSVAVVEAVATEPVVVRLAQEEVRETFVEIHAQPGGERLVASIEVLSPANKTPAGHGRTPYLEKQREILDSQVHLVEIDLLRCGVPTTAVPIDAAVAAVGFFDYHVCAHRWDMANTFYLYPIQLQRRLPVVAVPLLPGDAPVRVDLQASLDRAYDSGQYRRRVRYREQPAAPPLWPDQGAWVEQTLRAAGLREAGG